MKEPIYQQRKAVSDKSQSEMFHSSV